LWVNMLAPANHSINWVSTSPQVGYVN
jgi:hypothetical protein